VRAQVEGRSLLPLLRDPHAPWGDRTLVTHVGRWPRGGAIAAKFVNMSIRNTRFSLVNNTELYDLTADPAQQRNVMVAHPEAAARLRSAYDLWWESVQPRLENENVTGPAENPFKALYRAQFSPASASKAAAAPN
jgi:arylsulfatase